MNNSDFFLALGPLGTPEMIIIFVLVLLLFGAKRLPGLARSIGKSLGEFRKAKDEFQEEITKGEDEGARSYETKRSAPEKRQPRPRPEQIATDAEPVKKSGDVAEGEERKPSTSATGNSAPA